ncbi:MAG: DUF3883 domain-containing protein [Gammaproteobacteria bacterium]|nr:DUF3883 domain-containing protein [Gammaproteobacteria bacterium]
MDIYRSVAKANSFHALLTDEYVAIANRGQPFTQEGLRAVCQAHISPKYRNLITPIKGEADAIRVLEKIRAERLEAYKCCPGDIAEHASAEGVLRNEYAGRILLELLQNAYDAFATKPIGSKGVGFKAVLNICDEPRIHSGSLHCTFDRQRSRNLLQDAKLVEINDPVPLLRFPFQLSQLDEPQEVRHLMEEYDTVIVLPFVDSRAHDYFLSGWDNCVNDARLLLFLEDLRCVIWEHQNREQFSRRVWSRHVRDACVEVCSDTGQTIVEKWRLWRSDRVSVALRLNEDGLLDPEQDYPKIRVFFETDEQSPIPILIHAKFPLKEGRANVLIEDDCSRESVQQIVGEIVERIWDALSEVSEPGLLFDLLCLRVTPEQMGKLESELWKALKVKLARLEIPGTNGLRLDQARLRPRDENKWWFDCNLWNVFKKALMRHSADEFRKLPFLPPGVDGSRREETVLHYNPDARLQSGELLTLPLLPITGNDQFLSPGGSSIFFPPRKAPPKAPDGINAHFLDLDFIQLMENHGKVSNLHRLLKEVLSVSEFKPDELVEKVILPFLDDHERRLSEDLLDFLCAVIEPELKDNDLKFDWRNPVRRQLAEQAMVATRRGNELPVVGVYAGADWTGNEFLEQAYGGCNDRGFLRSPPSDRDDKLRWERFYQWLGIGWGPKVLPIVCFENHPKTFKGPKWQHNLFPVDTELYGWHEYCKEIYDFEFNYRKSRMRQNWTLDGGEAVLSLDDAFPTICEHWESYEKYTEVFGFQSSNRKEDFDNQRWSGPSYLMWLFRTSYWVPVKGGAERQQPVDTFTRSEIVRELGGYAHKNSDVANENILKAIGVRSGWRELTDEDWRRWLDRASKHAKEKVNSTRELKDSIYSLYVAALRHWPSSSSPEGAWRGAIWCMERREDNTENWKVHSDRTNVYFVDRPDLDELRLPELWLLPVRLNNLENAAENLFGLKPLSDYLSGQPEDAKRKSKLAEQVQRRIFGRIDAINAYLGIGLNENNFRFTQDNVPDVKVVENLKIRLRIGGKKIGDNLVRDAYHSQNSEGCWTLWLNHNLFGEEPNTLSLIIWEHVSSALVYAGGLPLDVQPCLKDLLLYENSDLSRKLLQLGVTKETVNQLAQYEITTATIPPADIAGLQNGSGRPVTPLDPNPKSPSKPGSVNHSGNRGKSSTSTKQPGREAEDWIREKLKQRLAQDGWRVSPSQTHDEEYRETDIELFHARYGTFHVEVKHREKSEVYWSENEVSKAQENPGRYFMAILVRNDQTQFKEYWLVDPLDKFKDVCRAGVWEWRGRQDGIDLSGQDDPWAVPVPRAQRSASGFVFKMEVSLEWLQENCHEFSHIQNYMMSLLPVS